MAIKLVALDIDGTLLDSHGNLPTENGRAIEESVRERREDHPCQRTTLEYGSPSVCGSRANAFRSSPTMGHLFVLRLTPIVSRAVS